MEDPDEPLSRGDIVHYRLFALLRRLGFRMTIATELDDFHAIDILVTGHARHKGAPRMALQITVARKSNGKAGRFSRWAGKRIKGPLLYVRCRGEATLPMAEALRSAIFDVWNDPDWRSQRARGLVIRANGTRRWFRIPQPTP